MGHFDNAGKAQELVLTLLASPRATSFTNRLVPKVGPSPVDAGQHSLRAQGQIPAHHMLPQPPLLLSTNGEATRNHVVLGL